MIKNINLRALGVLTLGAAFVGMACSSAPSPDDSPVDSSSNASTDSSTDPSAELDSAVANSSSSVSIDIGNRPDELLSVLAEGELKNRLSTCDTTAVQRSNFSISHRGAPLRLPEHSREGYLAAVEQGAGIVECDVTFTNDAEPVCRHSQCDLHTTTNILDTDLSASCSVPPDHSSETPYANVRCCASDLSLAEFSTLRAKRDGANRNATSLEDYLAGTPDWTGEPATDYATLMTLAESIALLEPLGVSMTPELKSFESPVEDDGTFARDVLSQRMFDTFKNAGVEPERLYPQSFELDDISLWHNIEPTYAQNAVWLDGRYATQSINGADASGLTPDFDELADLNIAYLAPPIWMLLTLDEDQQIVPSDYARRANAAGLRLLTWSLERSPDADNGGFYYQSIADVYDNAGDQLRALEILVNDVGVEGVFSDWPATTTWFAHCNPEGRRR